MDRNAKGIRRRVFVYLDEAGYNGLRKLMERSTEKSLSHLATKLLGEKPVMIKYRNTSIDDFLRDMVPLRKELNQLASGFNEAVRDWRLLERIPEFRGWVQENDERCKALIEKVEIIKVRISQLYQLWLQE